MHAAFLTVVILTAGANIYAGISDFTRPAWLLANMKRLDVEERWLPTLGVLHLLGGVGVLAGFRIPPIGLAAAAGLVVFFLGAVVVSLRARWYEHLPFPLVWLVLAAGSFALILRAA
jgi:hypothetical protein